MIVSKLCLGPGSPATAAVTHERVQVGTAPNMTSRRMQVAGFLRQVHSGVLQSIGKFLGRPEALGKICVLGAIVVVLLFFPGFMSNDSAVQLLEARRGAYSDLHPPLMALIWRCLDAIISGPFLMLVLQSGLVFGGLFLIAVHLDRRSSPLVPILPLATAFMPPVLGILGVIWKDILMAGLLLCSFGLTMKFRCRAKDRRRSGYAVLAGCAAFLAVSMRYNAVGAGGGAVWFLADSALREAKGKRRLSLSGVITMIAMPAVLWLSLRLADAIADQASHQRQANMVFDLVGTSLQEGEVLFSQALTTGELQSIVKVRDMSLEDLRSNYSPRFWRALYKGENPLFELSQDPQDLQQLRRLWLLAIREHPRSYLIHRWQVFNYVLLLKGPLWVPVYSRVVETDEHHTLLQHDYPLSRTQLWVASLLQQLSSRPLLFNPGWWLLVCSGLCVASLFWLERNQGIVFFLCFSGISHELTLFFAATTPEYRYSHWMILSTWLSLLVVIVDVLSKLAGHPASEPGEKCRQEREPPV